jgi:uncharacterized membrane protein YhdT
LRPLELAEKKALYRLTKTVLVVLGLLLIAYGAWFLLSGMFYDPHDVDLWFGIFPVYLGAMMILISLAMKIEWFTDARKFW